jgi:hypothetical protein
VFSFFAFLQSPKTGGTLCCLKFQTLWIYTSCSISLCFSPASGCGFRICHCYETESIQTTPHCTSCTYNMTIVSASILLKCYLIN